MNFVRRKRALPRTLNRIIYWITVFLTDHSFLNIYNAFPLPKEGRTFKTDESRPLTTNRPLPRDEHPAFRPCTRGENGDIFSAVCSSPLFVDQRPSTLERGCLSRPFMCSFIWPRVTYLPALCPSINYRPQLLPSAS